MTGNMLKPFCRCWQFSMMYSVLLVGLLCLSFGVPAEAKKRRTLGKVESSRECHDETGRASYYDEDQTTASLEHFNPDALTAAHPHWPMNSRLRVTNASNGKSVEVRINDRGPYTGGRIIDLSRASFAKIASLKAGVIKVKIEVLSCGSQPVEKKPAGWFGFGGNDSQPTEGQGRD